MIEDSLYTALATDSAVAAIVGARIHPVVAPDGTAFPYVLYHTVTSRRDGAMNGAGTLRNARVQIDCYAATYAQSKSLGAAVRAAVLAATAFKSVLNIEQDLYDASTKTHRQLVEFSIWQTES